MTKLMRPFGFGPFPTLFPRDVFDEMFEKLSGGLDTYNPTTGNLSLRNFPKGDVYTDKNGNRVIELALAGYNKDQLSVTIEDDSLVISATKCDGDCEDEGQSRTLARRAFKQVFSNVTKEFDLNKTEVVYKDGLLKVVVPKSQKEELIKVINIK